MHRFMAIVVLLVAMSGAHAGEEFTLRLGEFTFDPLQQEPLLRRDLQ